MNVLGTAILLVGLLATVSLSCKHSPGALQRVADEDYQVYSAYLNDFIFLSEHSINGTNRHLRLNQHEPRRY